jgi:hypothetical protein
MIVYNKEEDNGPAVVEIHVVGGEVKDTVEKCITPRSNGIHGSNTSTLTPIPGKTFYFKFNE